MFMFNFVAETVCLFRAGRPSENILFTSSVKTLDRITWTVTSPVCDFIDDFGTREILEYALTFERGEKEEKSDMQGKIDQF